MENQIKEALSKFEALIREQLERNEKIKATKLLNFCSKTMLKAAKLNSSILTVLQSKIALLL